VDNVAFAGSLKSAAVQYFEHGRIDSFSYSPNASALALAVSGVAVCQDLGTSEISQLTGQGAGVGVDRIVAYSPDSRYLVVLGEAGVRFYDPTTLVIVRSCETPAICKAMSFSPDGSKLATADANGRSVSVWCVDTGDLIERLSVGVSKTSWASAVHFSPDGSMLAAGFRDGFTRAWDTSSWKMIWSAEAPLERGWSEHVAFAPDSLTLVSAFKSLRFLNASSGQHIGWASGFFQHCCALTFCPGGRYVVVGTNDGSLHFWEPVTRRQICRVKAHSGMVTALSFSSDGRFLFSSAEDGRLLRWGPIPDLNIELCELGRHVVVPALGNSYPFGRPVREARIVRWLHQPDEAVETGAPLLELAWKADDGFTVEPIGILRAPSSGTVLRINAPAGTTVEEGMVIAEIDPSGSTDALLPTGES